MSSTTYPDEKCALPAVPAPPPAPRCSRVRAFRTHPVTCFVVDLLWVGVSMWAAAVFATEYSARLATQFETALAAEQELFESQHHGIPLEVEIVALSRLEMSDALRGMERVSPSASQPVCSS